ncbi:hypothetical protein Psta_1409 [Pirellula staleyi DSM 6068]|uniref:Uncharacterized protein n=1 Tax=Pirellula staleyi (strain ATCC 27377 / DSM 6068 / ICPB 4128) TaxID=530564 RepID=D2QWY1_PIRSD|nr:hypothetical protein Psta_1409 [Pirellula staleyi DSM 6068]
MLMSRKQQEHAAVRRNLAVHRLVLLRDTSMAPREARQSLQPALKAHESTTKNQLEVTNNRLCAVVV